MASTAPLSASAQVVLDGSGNGSVSIGPTGFGETWTSVAAAVHCATNVNEATCRFYVGPSASPNYFAGATTFGSTGDASPWSGQPIPVGQFVFAVWSGGDSGTTAYLSLSGTRSVA